MFMCKYKISSNLGMLVNARQVPVFRVGVYYLRQTYTPNVCKISVLITYGYFEYTRCVRKQMNNPFRHTRECVLIHFGMDGIQLAFTLSQSSTQPNLTKKGQQKTGQAMSPYLGMIFQIGVEIDLYQTVYVLRMYQFLGLSYCQ